jgi:hypothetical protein
MKKSNHGFNSALAIVVAAVVLAGAATGSLLWLRHRSRANARKLDVYQLKVQEDWRKIASGATDVSAAIVAATNPSELPLVQEAAARMRADLANILTRARGDAPGGYELEEEEIEAIEALDSYLEMTEQLSTAGRDKILADRGLLENRSAGALSKVNEFLGEATFMNILIPGEFYQAGLTLQYAYEPPEDFNDPLKTEYYHIATAFLDADILDFNPDVLWSLTSTTRRTALELLGVSKEKFAADWRKAWGERVPVEYYLSRQDINPGDQNTAVLKVVVYLDDGSPVIEEIRLVLEPGGWKVEDYPFVGWG